MLAIDRWRNWRPPDEKMGESPGSDPTKPTKPPFVSFVSSTSEQIDNFSDRPPDAPDAWAEDFHRWALECCAYRDRCFGGIPALCADFGKWAVTHDSVPCRIDAFEALLRDAGFLCADGLVSGLILKSDLWALENSRKETVQCHI